ETSMGAPFSVSLSLPMLSKCSRESPMGSEWVWQEAQAGVVAWAKSRWRTVFKGPFVLLTMEKSTLAGGRRVGSQRQTTLRTTPRLVGEHPPGWANIHRMLT